MVRFHQPDSCVSLRTSVRQHIDSLGSTPDAIADRLADSGVKGVPGKASDCAIARYLHAVVGGAEPVNRLAIYHGSVRIYRSGSLFPAVVRLRRPVSTFIRGFDLGNYPRLVDERSPRAGAEKPLVPET